MEITAPITTKFCTVTKTTKYSSWVAPTRVENPRWRTAANLKNGKSAIEQYLLMRRPVPLNSAIHRVSKYRIICYVIYCTYFT